MSHFQSNSLCNKLQKWMNLKSLPSVHTSNTHCSHAHNHSHNNSIIMSSPYKKTTFETLLRRYPKNEDELKGSRISFENEHKENPKRTFESRIIKYDNVKSKIDTNLGNLKQSKCQPSVPQVNDENKNTQNIMLLNQQQQNEKINYQKPLIKKIKLNSEYFQKFEKEKNEYQSCVDIEDMIMKHNFRPSGYEEKVMNGKMMFRINVAKKINLFNKKQENDGEIQQENQRQENRQQMNQGRTENEQNQMPSAIILQKPQNQSEPENQEQSPEQPMKLLNFESIPKLIFKELGSKGFDVQQNDENSQSQEENDIFTLDGYRILEVKDQMENYQSQHYEQQKIQAQELHGIKQTPFQEIEQNYDQDSSSSQNKPVRQQIGQTYQPAQQTPSLSENQVIFQQNAQIFPQTSQSLIKNIQNQPSQSTEQKQNMNQNIQVTLQSQKPKLKLQKQRIRRNSMPKKEFLTRSKDQKLNLFNQLSMRLIRKKYGQELSHSELADRMLSEENKIRLKVFIESESFQSHKTVFNFNELTQTQMRNTLIKYFASEQKIANPQ